MQPVLGIAALLKTFLISDVLDDTLGQMFPGTLASRRVPEIKWHDPVPFYLNTQHAPNNFICAKQTTSFSTATGDGFTWAFFYNYSKCLL
jgi:hypothetical protein